MEEEKNITKEIQERKCAAAGRSSLLESRVNAILRFTPKELYSHALCSSSSSFLSTNFEVVNGFSCPSDQVLTD